MTNREQNPAASPGFSRLDKPPRPRYDGGRTKKEGPPVTVSVDAGRCIACGMCAFAAPEVFRIVGRASAVVAQPEGENPRVRDAANGCPVNAISVWK